MSQHDDFDRSLARWLDTEARPAATAEVLDRALGATSRRRPRPRLFAALGSHWVGDSVGPTSGVATVGRTGGRTALALVLLLLVLALVAAAVQVGARLLQPAPAELGIFAPVAGRIVSGVWAVNPEAVDPSAPSRWTPLRMGPEEVLAVGWSSNGTELLFMRKDPTQTFPFATNLFILHADGTETQLTKDGMEMWGATIAPDGSRVVYAARDVDAARSAPPSLFAGDAKGGQPIRIADEGEGPTFSPDGSQIAYVVNNTGEAHVWVADADGSDAHEILADEPTFLAGVDELAWSPTGDRIAMGNNLEGHAAIYTFAPDGSDFTKVITGGMNAFWSPDGSQIAYLIPYDVPPGAGSPGLAIAEADGSNVREFGFAASGPWHPGTPESAPEPTSSASPATSSPLSPTASPRSEAEQILAQGSLDSFAASGSGTVLTLWSTCHEFGQIDCGFAWRLGDGSQPQATGVAHPGRAVYDSGDAFVPVAAGDGFILAPPIGDEVGIRIAPDGTTFSISLACRDVSWSTPTEPGRLVWTVGLNFVDTVAGIICPTSRLGGPPLARGAFTPDGTLWALLDNETGPATLTIGRYDGKQWDYHDFASPSGSWTSVLAAAGSTVVVLLANAEPSPQPDRLVGFAVSTDAGATWSEVVDPDVLERDLPFSAVVSANDEDWYSGYTSMAFAGPSTLYVADGNGGLWRSTDFATFSRVPISESVRELQSAGDAVIARTDGNGLVRISADGTAEPITIR